MQADRRIALWLGLGCFLFYALFVTGHLQGTDEVSVYETTRALYERGSLSVPQHQGAYAGRDGRFYSIFSVGQSALALPFYALGAALRDVLPAGAVRALAGPPIRVQTTVWGGTLEIFTTGLYAPFAAGVLIALFYAFERRLGVSRESAVAAGVLCGATTMVALQSIYFLQHTTEAIALLGALLGFLHWKQTGSLHALAAGSACAAAIPLVRMPASVAAPGLGLYLLHTLAVRARAGAVPWPRVAAAIALPVAALFAVHVASNHVKWGAWLMSPMLGQYARMTNPLGVGLLGFLASPGSSVWPYTPLLLLAPWTLGAMAKRHRAEVACALVICASFLLFCSAYDLWTGLYSSPGPRYLFVWTPLVLLSLGPWLDRRPSALGRGALVVLAAAGLAVQLVLLLASWAHVIEAGGYLRYQPPKGFLYVWSDTPIAVAFGRVLAGDLAPWLVALARGSDVAPAHPIAALATAALLLGGVAACGAMVVRALRAPASA
jgi:hypothetical protein